MRGVERVGMVRVNTLWGNNGGERDSTGTDLRAAHLEKVLVLPHPFQVNIEGFH